eukprot:scaffold73808_cov31-Attheya_sp.AAC.1
MVNQGEKQQTKVGTEIFVGGLQNHPDDVLAAITPTPSPSIQDTRRYAWIACDPDSIRALLGLKEGSVVWDAYLTKLLCNTLVIGCYLQSIQNNGLWICLESDKFPW